MRLFWRMSFARRLRATKPMASSPVPNRNRVDGSGVGARALELSICADDDPLPLLVMYAFAVGVGIDIVDWRSIPTGRPVGYSRKNFQKSSVGVMKLISPGPGGAS